jgi:hypothetical protein
MYMSDSNEEEVAKKMGMSIDELREWHEDLLEATMYPILLKMLNNNLIDLEKADDPMYLWGVAGEKMLEITPEFFILLHKDFLEVAQYCVENDKQPTAIILVATAIEHVTNIFYRSLLSHKGLPDAQITEIVKRNNIEAKLGWLLTVTSNATLPDYLLNNIKEIIELRNALVHYKAIPEKWDVKSGSWENIKPKIDKIDYEQLLDIPDELDYALMEILEDIDPSRKIARKLWHTMINK